MRYAQLAIRPNRPASDARSDGARWEKLIAGFTGLGLPHMAQLAQKRRAAGAGVQSVIEELIWAHDQAQARSAIKADPRDEAGGAADDAVAAALKLIRASIEQPAGELQLHPDAELLALAPELERRWKIEHEGARFGLDRTDEQIDADCSYTGEIAHAIHAIRPKTLDGFRIRARAVAWHRSAFDRPYMEDCDRSCRGTDEFHAAQLIDDLIGADTPPAQRPADGGLSSGIATLLAAYQRACAAHNEAIDRYTEFEAEVFAGDRAAEDAEYLAAEEAQKVGADLSCAAWTALMEAPASTEADLSIKFRAYLKAQGVQPRTDQPIASQGVYGFDTAAQFLQADIVRLDAPPATPAPSGLAAPARALP